MTLATCAACGQPRDGDYCRDGHHPGCVPNIQTLRHAWVQPGADRAGIEKAAALCSVVAE